MSLHVILGSLIQPVPSLCLPGLVSTIPHTPLTSCGPSHTKAQLCDTHRDSLLEDENDTLLFETTSEQCCQECIADFINATGAEAMASSICTISAGSFFWCRWSTVLWHLLIWFAHVASLILFISITMSTLSPSSPKYYIFQSILKTNNDYCLQARL